MLKDETVKYSVKTAATVAEQTSRGLLAGEEGE